LLTELLTSPLAAAVVHLTACNSSCSILQAHLDALCQAAALCLLTFTSCASVTVSCRGRYCSWGFPDVDNVTKAVVEAPGPNMYIAALRGYEGKPLPPNMGGFNKR
jgi:hypothetical protein